MAGPKKNPPVPAPDGEPRPPAKDRDSTRKIQDPLISGDVGKQSKRVETDEAQVDEAGQVRRRNVSVDLLH